MKETYILPCFLRYYDNFKPFKYAVEIYLDCLALIFFWIDPSAVEIHALPKYVSNSD